MTDDRQPTQREMMIKRTHAGQRIDKATVQRRRKAKMARKSRRANR